MTTDPRSWFLTSQALDHHATAAALEEAINSTGTPVSGLAEPLASELAALGYALVHIDGEHGDLPVMAMDIQIDGPAVPGFLDRRKD
jgi:hypothetical protein